MTQPHIDIWHSNLRFYVLLFKFYVYFLHWYFTPLIFLPSNFTFYTDIFILEFCVFSSYTLHWHLHFTLTFTVFTDISHFTLACYIYTDILYWFIFHICNKHFTFYILHFTSYILHLHFTVFTWYLTVDIWHWHLSTILY